MTTNTELVHHWAHAYAPSHVFYVSLETLHGCAIANSVRLAQVV